MHVSRMESRRYTFHRHRVIVRRTTFLERHVCNDKARHRAGLCGSQKRKHASGRIQSPTTRRPNTSDAKPTCCALPLMFMRIVVGFLKNCLAWASVRP